MDGAGPTIGDNSPLVIGLLVLGALAGMHFQKFLWQLRRGDRRRSDRGRVFPFEQRLPDAADQLRTVMKAEFKARPLLNKSEARMFRAMDKIVLGMRPGWQVMAQVSLGEILRCEDAADVRSC